MELSHKLGIPASELKEALTQREYSDHYKFYVHYGFGERGASIRNAHLMDTIQQYITGAAGGKPASIDPEDFYPQLSFEPKSKRQGNNAVDWENTRPGLQQELIELGLYDEDGNPTNSKTGDA